MARFRRYGRRRYYRRSRFGRRRFGRRFGRRRYGRRRSSSTRSAPVKLTLEADFNTLSSATSAQPFTFLPTLFPGFAQYRSVYSEFRVISTKMYIHRTTDPASLPTSYLVVSSGPFADTRIATATDGSSVVAGTFPGNKTETELRQARWQRLIYPSTTRTVTKIRFRPYTFQLTGGPVSSETTDPADTSLNWMKRYDARRWMPMQWATTYSRTGLTFYGPYVWLNTPTGGTPASPGTIRVTLECFFQFRGQV